MQNIVIPIRPGVDTQDARIQLDLRLHRRAPEEKLAPSDRKQELLLLCLRTTGMQSLAKRGASIVHEFP